jgi:hypothetical protein
MDKQRAQLQQGIPKDQKYIEISIRKLKRLEVFLGESVVSVS